MLIDMIGERDLLLVEDHYEVAEGVAVHLVPGHTAGTTGGFCFYRCRHIRAGGRFVLAPSSALIMLPQELVDLLGKRIPIPILPEQDFYSAGHSLPTLNDFYESANKLLTISGSRDTYHSQS
jgi:hypothetical protein